MARQLTDDQLQFLKDNRKKGAKWIAEALGIKYHKVVNVAHRHRISLKDPMVIKNGRPMLPITLAALWEEISAEGTVCRLPIDHPVIIGIWEQRTYMGKEVLWTRQWKQQRLRVLARDAYTCVYCGEPANEVDHVVPRAKGGSHDLDNLVAACRRCNGIKGAREQSSFLAQPLTPPVFLDNLSPRAASVIPENPFVTESTPIIN